MGYSPITWFYRRLLFVVLLVGLFGPLKGQKVGLVLSGGGAKGLAHIGVIKALEDEGIPIDYITGTSMGAIVGALYVMGYSPEEMEALFKSREFERWYKGITEEDFVYYFKQPPADASFLTLRIDPKEWKIQLPTNLVSNDQINFAFLKIFSRAGAVCLYNFDNLMIPFRCVAADIYNNRPVVLRDGNLGDAVRASMTYPFFFKPIKIDGNLLFDGGIYNNFPSDVMVEDFHPDVIIGSKVAKNKAKPDEENLLLQVENMIMARTNYQVPDSLGLVIETKVDEVNLLDFHQYDRIFTAGYTNAQSMMEEIKSLVTRRKKPEELAFQRRRFKDSQPDLLFKNIQYRGVSVQQINFISKIIRQDQDVFDVEHFKNGYFKALAEQKVKSIIPKAVFNDESGYFDLLLDVKLDDKLNVNVGGHLSTGALNEGFLGIEFQDLGQKAYSYWANSYFGEFYVSAQGGIRVDYPSKVPLYIKALFTYNQWDYFSGNIGLIYKERRPHYLVKDETTFSSVFGLPLRWNGKMELGLGFGQWRYEYYQSQDFSRGDNPDESINKGFVFSWNLEKNTLDEKQDPVKGTFKNLNFKYTWADEEVILGNPSEHQENIFFNPSWFSLSGSFEHYEQISGRFDGGISLKGAYSNHSLSESSELTEIQSLTYHPTSHRKTRYMPTYQSNLFFGLGLKPIWIFSDRMHIRNESYLFFPFQKVIQGGDNKHVFSRGWQTPDFFNSSAFIFKTPIGPISLNLNYYSSEPHHWFFLVSWGYAIFNKSVFLH